ncbi:ATP-binding protein [Aliikangiella marina]|uniref:ATP-binding protein n=1 Tax=Aliikangiella marina TaxID=1712262 RepID=A0A545T2S3_9GAMM|nr:ATP-binding protein [Aliikangiella marina]TQV71510.1 ATP-binding protein [Aliikangiella marina]
MGDVADKFYESLLQPVKVGLLAFMKFSGSQNYKSKGILEQELKEAYQDASIPEWIELKGLFECQLKEIPKKRSLTPIEKLIKNYQLTPRDVFMLTLIGELEDSMTLGLCFNELQFPQKGERPALHTIAAILDYLFDDASIGSSILMFKAHPLIKDAILSIEGEEPMPFRRLKVNPDFWLSLKFTQISPALCTLLSSQFLNQQSRYNESESRIIASLIEQTNPEKFYSVVTRGEPGIGKAEFAYSLARHLNLTAVCVSLEQWNQDKSLSRLCQYLDLLPVIAPQIAPGESIGIDYYESNLVVLLGKEGTIESKNILEVDLQLPCREERQQFWSNSIKDHKLTQELADTAILSGKSIATIAAQANQFSEKENRKLSLNDVLRSRRYQGAEKLRLLAEPVERLINKDDMVFPDSVKLSIEHLLLRAKKRQSIFTHLGSTMKATANPGVNALFVGESGTGKTLAASYVANQLAAPLFRVDLSSVMNKYIGESEKNLSEVLTEAAAKDVVLLFDEADALFGNRTEGKGTGERFANMLTNFLLTRIESHPGVVILTSNSKDRIDSAFNRRIDLMVEFPVPGFAERLALWNCHLGESNFDESLSSSLASHCQFAGGQVRNAVLTAATVAKNGSIKQADLYQGLKVEYEKMGRNVPGNFQYLANDTESSF